MKCIFSILCLSFTINSAYGQFGKETWTKVTHTIDQLIVTNDNVKNKIDSLLFSAPSNDFWKEYQGYSYFHVHVKDDHSKDSACQDYEIRLSKYPYKSDAIIGFYTTNNHYIFIYDKLPKFLSKIDGERQEFSYNEHKIGNLLVREDDMPYWFISFRDGEIILKNSPF